jgi:hypothetical protein
MRVRNLLTHSQKKSATSVSLCIWEQIFANQAEGYRREVLSRHVAKHRRRSDETLLKAVLTGYIRATSKSQLTRVDVHMKNGMQKPEMVGRQTARRVSRASALVGALAVFATAAFAAGPNADQATRMYNRIAGVPPTASQLSQMMAAADPVTAALIATKDPSFYNNTIRNMAMPWTNRDQTVFAPLNDYVATVIGMVRDDVAFNTLLTADIIYIAGSGAAGIPAYSPANNDMYEALDTDGTDLSNPSNLKQTTQSSVTGIPSAAVAGVLTTRAAANAFFMDGTNRRMFRFTMINHLCNDLQTVMDITRPPDRIRQDVTRSPGGVSTLFLTNCIGCHSGMDPMAQAFAYYQYQYDVTTDPTGAAGQIVYTAGQVQPKYHINNTNFPQGFSTPDDSWSNRWRAGPNEVLGWSGSLPGSGTGANSLGKELESSAAFTSCQVTRVFKEVCLRAPNSAADNTQINSMIASFQSNGYRLRQPFAEAAAYCKGN